MVLLPWLVSIMITCGVQIVEGGRVKMPYFPIHKEEHGYKNLITKDDFDKTLELGPFRDTAYFYFSVDTTDPWRFVHFIQHPEHPVDLEPLWLKGTQYMSLEDNEALWSTVLEYHDKGALAEWMTDFELSIRDEHYFKQYFTSYSFI